MEPRIPFAESFARSSINLDMHALTRHAPRLGDEMTLLSGQSKTAGMGVNAVPRGARVCANDRAVRAFATGNEMLATIFRWQGAELVRS